MQRRTFLAIATTMSMLGFAAPAHADALASIMESGTIKIAVPQDFPPFGSVGTDLESVGYDIDVANLIGERLGVTAELIPVTSANRIPYLQTGMADLVISSLGKNAEREAVIDFTDAYAPFFNGVFGPDTIDVAAVADLGGYTVGVTRGAVEDLTLTGMVGDDVEISRYEDNNGTISAFLSGQVDLIATGNVVAAAILERNPPVRPELKFLVQNSPCYIGLNKEEPELMAAINAIIAEIKGDGSLEAISQAWLGQPLPADL
jgi:polar amino acid transport system substrate-binding protein